MKMKGLVVAAAMLASSSAFAGATGNVGGVSEYMFRGLSQNPDDPSIQGGLDYAFDSGLYVGTWASNIDWGAGGTELDLYGGFTKKFTDLIGIDVGAIGYIYPEKGEPGGLYPDANTVEVYAGLLVGPVTFKAYYSPSYFGAKEPGGGDLKNLYFVASGAFPLSETLNLTGSIGYTSSSDDAAGGFCPNVAYCEVTDSYIDYSVGIAKTLDGGFTATLAVVGTNLKPDDGSGNEKTDKPSIVIGLKKTFDL
ncbi:MAG: hypothetical protein JWQ90_765 [Hydrocarboniphaga sp.]|uniref:TorF family putative porin n=1 Tax=Hydrocarboniphaga sp. TaxID=2033016 RepID=UPI0026023744|nr:TorF family putative porin [Hydrocarboniphaga sp.]MDB5968315.1 hypothetical protein [Hydrocarboniphaga sp.]